MKARALERLQSQHTDLDRELNDALVTIAGTAVGTDARTAAEARRDVIVSQITAASSRRARRSTGVDTSPGPADPPGRPARTRRAARRRCCC